MHGIGVFCVFAFPSNPNVFGFEVDVPKEEKRCNRDVC